MNILVKFKRYFVDLLFGYQSNNQVYNLYGSSGNTARYKKFILILERSRYEESSKNFPIENSKDLDKVVRLGDFKYDIYSYSPQNGSPTLKVNFWNIHDLGALKAAFVLPETLVLASALKKEFIYEIEGEKGPYYFINTDNGFYSAFRTPLMSSPELFAAATGVSFLAVEKLNTAQLKQALIKGIDVLPYHKLLNLRVKRDGTKVSKPTYRVFLPAIALLFFYYLATSAYLLIKQSSLDTNLSTYQVESKSLSVQKSKLEKDVELIREIESLLNDSSKTSKIWTILYPLYELQIRFTAIRIDGSKVYLSGFAPSALAALEELNKNSSVKNAQFRGAQLSSRKGERFTLEFTYE